MGRKDRLAGFGDLAVLKLGGGLGAQLDVVDPAAERALHVEHGGRAEGQDAAGGFFGYAGFEHLEVQRVRLVD